MALVPSFNINYEHQISCGLCVLGYFNGRHPSIACVSSPDIVTIHTPAEAGTDQEQRTVNVNQPITSLSIGSFGSQHDYLLIGTASNLMVYNVEKNESLFYTDIAGGVYCIKHGHLNVCNKPVVIVGGNCSIIAFDEKGEEVYWTVASDIVNALEFYRHNMNDEKNNNEISNSLVVGTDDCEIRFINGEDTVDIIHENGSIAYIIQANEYLAYALKNGTIGVYKGKTRLWSMKMNDAPTCIQLFDINNNGNLEFIIGWMDGSIHMREIKTGNLIYEDELSDSVSGLLVGDYRMEGRTQLICCAKNGELRGFVSEEKSTSNNMNTLEKAANEAHINELYEKRQRLYAQIHTYDESLKKLKSSNNLNAALVPADTTLDKKIILSERNTVQLELKTNNETSIKAAVLNGNGLFQNSSECAFFEAPEPSSIMKIDLAPLKNEPLDITASVIVGHRSSPHDHVFNINAHIPRFATFVFVPPHLVQPYPSGQVLMNCNGRASRVALWVQRNFLTNVKDVDGCLHGENFFIAFRSINNAKELLTIKVNNINGGEIRINTNNMDLAGDIIQDLCDYLRITDLETTSEFDHEIAAFREVLTAVEDHNNTRQKLIVETADVANSVKNLVVRAEDARLIGHPYMMNRMYTELYALNQDLIGEYTKRSRNHEELLNSLKKVNQMIQRAARLRVGKYQQQLITACRAAIKKGNTQALTKLISIGAK